MRITKILPAITAEESSRFRRSKRTFDMQRLSGTSKVISTDPPYYDNISYADLSDFFYVWLRRSREAIFPNYSCTLFRTEG